jgi:hypothetical protein
LINLKEFFLSKGIDIVFIILKIVKI